MTAWHNARYAVRILAVGTWVLVSRAWTKLWSAGRADDDVVGPVVLVVVGAGMIYVALVSVPILASPLTVAWLIAAGAAGHRRLGPAEAPSQRPAKAAPEAEETPRKSDPAEVYTATLGWIRQQIGDRQGVHLRDLLEHAQAHGMFQDLDVSTLRAHLERWGIPVRDRVRVRGLGVTVGIHKDDLPAPAGPSPASSPQEAAGSELQAH